MLKSDRVKKIIELLKRDYPVVKTPLYHQTVFQLVVATSLSAQTLDASVNKVTPMLFAKYPTAIELSKADPVAIEKIIKTVNYHKTKAKNIIAMANKILDDYNGRLPNSIEELIKLPGVGRKTANVVISEWFAKPIHERRNWPLDPLPLYQEITPQNNDPQILPEGFVVDTHVIRCSKRLGLTKHSDPKKIEKDLMKIFSQEEWNDMSLRIIFHGRYRCTAKSPKCSLDPEWSQICSCARNI